MFDSCCDLFISADVGIEQTLSITERCLFTTLVIVHTARHHTHCHTLWEPLAAVPRDICNGRTAHLSEMSLRGHLSAGGWWSGFFTYRWSLVVTRSKAVSALVQVHTLPVVTSPHLLFVTTVGWCRWSAANRKVLNINNEWTSSTISLNS